LWRRNDDVRLQGPCRRFGDVPKLHSNGVTITAYGYSNAGALNPVWQNAGGDENGLGIAGTSSDNEIDTNTFVQVDLNGIITAGGKDPVMVVNSVQRGETYTVYGSNTLASIGVPLGQVIRTANNSPFPIQVFRPTAISP